MTKPIEMSHEELSKKLAEDTPREQHVVYDDRRLKPFLTEDEFNRKWGLSGDTKN